MNSVCTFLMILAPVLAASKPPSDPHSVDFRKYINTLNTTWQAKRNFNSLTSFGYINTLMGVPADEGNYKLPIKSFKNENIIIPNHFDSRLNWEECPSISEIYDQGSCGSCWAIAAAGAISDRICIHSYGKVNVRISSENLLSCCYKCGKGCKGGYPTAAWNHWVDEGIVTGGPYGSNMGCKPYKEEPCDLWSSNGKQRLCDYSKVHVSICSKVCDPNYKNLYRNDLHYGRSAYMIKNNTQSIQMEIAMNGPVQAIFTVYEDFLSYGEGVYKHVAGKKIGKHSVKIIGWGTENEIPYWLVANSWNTYWGDKGFFKILSGVNECGIESKIMAGLPRKSISTKYKENNKSFNFKGKISNFKSKISNLKSKISNFIRKW